jgi:aryl sulfotransferase
MKPELLHHYQSALINAKRWEHFVPRDNDIIVTTSYKAGTTWMQAIVAALVFQQPQPSIPQDLLTPWIEGNNVPIDDIIGLLNSQTHRRYMKTHLPLDGLRFFDKPKYIFVGRDGKDVYMSMWNHWNNLAPHTFELLNSAPDRKGPDMALPPADLSDSFDQWLRKGTYPWENNGFPFWSHLHHAKSWWDFRHLPNILFVHFDDLLNDIDGQMRRVASYLDIPVDEDIWPALLEGVSFKSMKENAEIMAPGATIGAWKSTSNFFSKGTSKRWEGVLTQSQVAEYDQLAKRELGDELANWLAHGETA